MPAKDLYSYIAQHPEWADELERLHKAIARPELEVAIKWGIPNYLYSGKIILGLAAFKNHCALWFSNGVFLKDPAGVLINTQKGKTRAMRQWRIEDKNAVDYELVRAYVGEAIKNQDAGKALKPQKKELIMPDELEKALSADSDLHAAFKALTAGRQREYAEHIAEAKRAETRKKRIEKASALILDGLGLNDKYR